ncbi:MAG: hypothetical protein ACOCQW_02880 [Halanaerobiaceae bacterium]
MNRFYNLVILLFKDYYRRTYLWAPLLISAAFLWLIFNYNYAPYQYNYFLLFKSVFLILIAYSVTLHLNHNNYTRKSIIILSKVKASILYYAIAVVSFLITIFFSFLLDFYFLIIPDMGLSFFQIFNVQNGFVFLLIVLLSVSVTHLFAHFSVRKEYMPFGFLLLGFGAIPGWYENLFFPGIFKFINFVLPPISQNVLNLYQFDFSFKLTLYSILYLVIINIYAGYRIDRRSFSNIS